MTGTHIFSKIDVKVFDELAQSRQKETKHRILNDIAGGIMLSPTKTKRATNEHSLETVDAHHKFYNLKTTSYDRDRDNLT